MYLGTGKDMPLDWFLPLQAETGIVQDVTLCHLQRAITADETIEDNTVSSDTVVVVDPANVKKKLEDVLNKLRDKFTERIDQDPVGYEKAINSLEKTVLRLPNTAD